MPHGDLDIAAIVEESRLFTPADIEFAARRTAQLVFERVMFEHGEEQMTTGDVLRAIGQTRRTLTEEIVTDSSRTSRTTPGYRHPFRFAQARPPLARSGGLLAAAP